MEPLLFRPLIKRIRWGGTQLSTRLGKEIGQITDAAESWEVVDHGDDQSVVTTGAYAGTSLHYLVTNNADALFGATAGLTQFPLLIKFLDASDVLSVQVHPNDQQAKQIDPDENGKTEAWVIIEAEPESFIYAGLKAGIDRTQFIKAIENDQIEDCLHRVSVSAGDCFFIPAGTVHAIGGGILLAEIQQSSDLTFRIHDWNWVDDAGQPRPLHLEQALNCINFEVGPVQPAMGTPLTMTDVSDTGVVVEQFVECEYFVIRRWTVQQDFVFPVENRCHVLMVIEGTVFIQADVFSQQLRTGQTIVIPAASPSVTLQPVDGEATLLETYLP